MPITPEVLDQILKDYEKPEDLLSENGLLQQLTKALVERALNGEMTHHLGYEKHNPAGEILLKNRGGGIGRVEVRVNGRELSPDVTTGVIANRVSPTFIISS